MTALVLLLAFAIGTQSCKEESKEVRTETKVLADTPEYFNLRPEVEKAYGYSHAVKIVIVTWIRY